MIPNALMQESPPENDEDEGGDANEAIEAITEAADKTTEAAGELWAWITSGRGDALLGAVIVIGALAAMILARRGAIMVLKRLPRRDRHSLSAMGERLAGRLRSYFLLPIALLIADLAVRLPDGVSEGLRIVVLVAGVAQIAELIQEFALSWVNRTAERRPGDATTLATAANVVRWLLNVAVWSIALLLILDNIGADVTALLAGLGIGGVAIGLAAQGAFRDVFSAFSIIFDRPFQRGDTIRYGDTWGAIEDIGLKTTRIRSMHGEQIVITNTNLLEHEIHNMRRIARRRIETVFSIIYQTSPDMAERAREIGEEVVEETPDAEFERCDFEAFGDSSLNYDFVFYSLKPDYRSSKAVRSAVLLRLFRRFREEGLEFAYPTRTLHVESFPGGGSSEPAFENTDKDDEGVSPNDEPAGD